MMACIVNWESVTYDFHVLSCTYAQWDGSLLTMLIARVMFNRVVIFEISIKPSQSLSKEFKKGPHEVINLAIRNDLSETPTAVSS